MISSELAQQKENLDQATAEFDRSTVAYELIKRSVDDSNIYKDVYAMEKRVEVAREQVRGMTYPGFELPLLPLLLLVLA